MRQITHLRAKARRGPRHQGKKTGEVPTHSALYTSLSCDVTTTALLTSCDAPLPALVV
jgi:hypothetical protein